ncbi:rCG60996 [Rattus norvegicus]|uniref:RCG60996 n=1 Tax=Rattus norvegicus TaxID=10116 RepID=A6JKQ9_RAT|nr:rCG60996 [Rattus norvegicus]
MPIDTRERGLTSRRQSLLLHTSPIMRSARFKTEPTEHLGELRGRAETLNFTQRKVREANQRS